EARCNLQRGDGLIFPRRSYAEISRLSPYCPAIFHTFQATNFAKCREIWTLSPFLQMLWLRKGHEPLHTTLLFAHNGLGSDGVRRYQRAWQDLPGRFGNQGV